ncbi:MAG: helix-turn-helix transcriptional regulator, partial [Cyanobacteria bacterium J06632_3]
DSLRSARKDMSATQQEVARRLSVSLTTYQKYEQGDRVAGWVRVGEVASILNTTPNRILKFDKGSVLDKPLKSYVSTDLLAAAMQEVAIIAHQEKRLDDEVFWSLMAEATVKVIEMSLSKDSTGQEARTYLQGTLQGFLFDSP